MGPRFHFKLKIFRFLQLAYYRVLKYHYVNKEKHILLVAYHFVAKKHHSSYARRLHEALPKWDGTGFRKAGRDPVMALGRCAGRVKIAEHSFMVKSVVFRTCARDVIVGLDYLREKRGAIALYVGIIFLVVRVSVIQGVCHREKSDSPYMSQRRAVPKVSCTGAGENVPHCGRRRCCGRQRNAATLMRHRSCHIPCGPSMCLRVCSDNALSMLMAVTTRMLNETIPVWTQAFRQNRKERSCIYTPKTRAASQSHQKFGDLLCRSTVCRPM